MEGDFAPEGAGRDGVLSTAAIVVGFEAAAVGAAALLYATLGIVGDASRDLSFGIAALAAAAAFGLGFLARGLWNARRWATSPSLTWQVLQGFVGAYAISAGSPLLGIGLLVPALIGAAALAAHLARRSRV